MLVTRPIANLTNKTDDNDPAHERFIFTSTLLVLDVENGSTLFCEGGIIGSPVMEGIPITLSGEKWVKRDRKGDKTGMEYMKHG